MIKTPALAKYVESLPIDTDREEFKKFIQERGDDYMPRTEDQLFEIWKAARRAK